MTSSATVHEAGPAEYRNIEREQARALQQSLLPIGTLTHPNYEVSCRYSPLSEVGGDFADYFTLPDGTVGIYLGDVVGKGLPAAMYGALVMGMLRGIHKTGTNTAAVLALLNKRLLVRPVPAHYCSTIYAVYDPAHRQLSLSNAGLPYPLHSSPDSVVTLGQGGIPSGLFPGSEYETTTVDLAPGDTVLFATDGLHEMRNAEREDFSWGHLGKLWRRTRGWSADESLERLFEELHVFSSGAPRHDDITAVVLKIPENS
jgi:phosphoserine phosphatase RsbU/P